MVSVARRDEGKRSPVWIAIPVGIGLGVLVWDRFLRQKPLPPEQPAPPPPTAPPLTGIPEIDPILYEIDQAIAKLREITEFLRQSVQGADEVIRTNEATINEAQRVINEIKPRVVNKTATQQDAERLLATLEKVVNQFSTTNTLLVTLVVNINKAVKELEETIKSLEKQVDDLNYQLAPVDAVSSVSASGVSGRAFKSTPFIIPFDQAVNITGYVEAEGSWPFGCSRGVVNIRNKAGQVVKRYDVQSCCHGFWCDGRRRRNISENVSLPRGQYVIEALGEGQGGFTGAATARYKTARFLLAG